MSEYVKLSEVIGMIERIVAFNEEKALEAPSFDEGVRHAHVAGALGILRNELLSKESREKLCIRTYEFPEE